MYCTPVYTQILAQRPHIIKFLTAVLAHCKCWESALHHVTSTSCHGTSLEYGCWLFPLFNRNEQHWLGNRTI